MPAAFFLVCCACAFFWFQGKTAAGRYDGPHLRAAELLGVSPDADRAAITAAYRRLIARAHPDTGGDDHQAAALNHARDLLLAGIRAGDHSSPGDGHGGRG